MTDATKITVTGKEIIVTEGKREVLSIERKDLLGVSWTRGFAASTLTLMVRGASHNITGFDRDVARELAEGL